MPSDVKLLTITSAPGFPQTSAAYNRTTNRVGDRRHSKPLSPRAAILCVGVLNLIGWTAIMASVLAVL